jgi:FKBP-type peptidyl-prolyl cis-trans isomerase 2
MIAKGSKVTLHYTGTLADGTVFDSSVGHDPLTFTVGEQQVIPGFENGMLGLTVGDKKKIHVSKEDGYQYHSELIQTIPRSAAPPELQLKEGMTIALRAPTGQVIPAVVTKFTDADITIDMNPPLAGKELTFEVEILKVE